MNETFFKESVEKRGIEVLFDEPMSRHTTFKIGGNADMFIIVKDREELAFCVQNAKKQGVPYYICGNGSDLLVSDAGIEGAVISTEMLKGINITGDFVTVEAGNSVQSLCTAVMHKGLSGLEFAFGIPGTVGGAVYMNAGAYGGEIKDTIVSATYLDKSGEIKEISKEEMELSYRKSVFQENGGIILSAVFRLKKDDPDEILKKMNGYMERRKEKQPLEFPSAGSVFKRPEGNYAGTLIEKSGLKGAKCGGAEVSEKHAGFIVNTGGATSKDVKDLIKIIKDKVFKDSGIVLETEVIYIGR